MYSRKKPVRRNPILLFGELLCQYVGSIFYFGAPFMELEELYIGSVTSDCLMVCKLL